MCPAVWALLGPSLDPVPGPRLPVFWTQVTHIQRVLGLQRVLSRRVYYGQTGVLWPDGCITARVTPCGQFDPQPDNLDSGTLHPNGSPTGMPERALLTALACIAGLVVCMYPSDVVSDMPGRGVWYQGVVPRVVVPVVVATQPSFLKV